MRVGYDPPLLVYIIPKLGIKYKRGGSVRGGVALRRGVYKDSPRPSLVAHCHLSSNGNGARLPVPSFRRLRSPYRMSARGMRMSIATAALAIDTALTIAAIFTAPSGGK